jgi:hypothetical protein
MKRYLPVAITAALLTLAMTARTADVPHISGGIGSEERDQLRLKERDYNIKVITAMNPESTSQASRS